MVSAACAKDGSVEVANTPIVIIFHTLNLPTRQFYVNLVQTNIYFSATQSYYKIIDL